MNGQQFRLVNEQVRGNAMRAVQAAAIDGDAILVVRIEPEEKKRSVQQNKYLWGVVYKTIVDNDPGFFCCDAVDSLRKTARLSAAEVVHEFCKARFLPSADLPGLQITVAPSTAKLPRKEFQEYVEAIRRWAADELQVFVPDPYQAGYKDLGWLR
nr:MAG TPA: NinB protein [Caudoviricetes sp.]